MKKALLSFVLAVMLLVTFTGCDMTETLGNIAEDLADRLNEASSSSVESKTQVYAVPTEDLAGNAISVPDSLTKIVSLSPSLTQDILDLGLGQYLVAVDGDSNLLEGIPADLPSVDPQAPDAALLQELGTQIIFTRAEKGEDPLSQIKESGICVAYFPENISLNSIMEDILFLAACTKTDAAGEEIVFSMIEKMNEIKDIAKTITTPKTVYIETDGDFQTVGTRTILNEMVELAGGKNIFDDKDQTFTATSEQIISLNPDVILTFQQASEGSDPVEQIKGREGWEAITAVTSGAVYSLTFDYQKQDQSILTGLTEIAKAIYPALY